MHDKARDKKIASFPQKTYDSYELHGDFYMNIERNNIILTSLHIETALWRVEQDESE